MSDYDLGTARGKVVIDTDSVQQSTDQAQTGMQGVSKQAKLTGGQVMAMGGIMVGAGVAIAGGLTIAINAAADFEERISAIAAVSGATGDELDKIRSKALQLGADTKFSASEAASAMEELVKAGLSTTDVINGAADATVALAAAGEVDLTTAATIAANAMNAFNLQASDMPHIADLIAGAANASAIDVTDLGQSLQQAGAMAHLVGLPFDDLATAIGVMGNAGIRGSDAGTSLKTMLSNLQPQTKKQLDLMKDLGIITKDGANQFFDATGKIKSMSDIAGVLQTSLQGMTDAQKTATLETLFGSDAIRAAAVIADTGKQGMDDFAASMGKVSATDVAQKRMDNLGGSVEQMKGSIETFMITAGRPLQDVIRGIVDKVTEWVNSLASVDPKILKVAAIVAAAVAGLLILGGVLVMVAGGIMLVAGACAVLADNPVVLIVLGIIAALIALGVILYMAYQRFTGVRKAVDGLWQGLQAAWDWIMNTGVPAVKTFVTTVIALMVSLAGWIKSNVFPLFAALGDLISAVFMRVWPIIKFQIDLWRTIIEAFVTAVMWIWQNFGTQITNIVMAVFGFIKSYIETILAVITGIIRTVAALIRGDWSGAWEAIQGIIQAVWDHIQVIIQTVMTIISNIINIGIGLIQRGWNAAWGAMRSTVEGVIGAVISFVAGLPGRILGAIGSLGGLLWSKGAELIQGLINGISSMMGSLGSWISGLPSRVMGAFLGAGSWLFESGKKIIQGLIDGIGSMISKVGDVMHSVVSKVTGFLPFSPAKEGPLHDHPPEQSGEVIVSDLAAGIASGIGDIQAMMKALTPVITTPLTGLTVPVPTPAPVVNVQAPGAGGQQITTNVYGQMLTAEDVSRTIAWDLRFNG